MEQLSLEERVEMENAIEEMKNEKNRLTEKLNKVTAKILTLCT